MSDAKETITYNIGAFTLKISGQGQFAVTQFHLTKSIGALTQCVVTVADCTQMVKINPSSYPQKMGDIQKLFKEAIKTQNIGKLMDASLLQYTKNGINTWFIGKVSTVSPSLDTTYGVQAGLQCVCTGSACQLLYSPIADFTYVPQQLAKDITKLKSGGVFDNTLNQSAFAASNKILVQTIAKGTVNAKQTILSMINKCLNAVLQRKNTKSQELGSTNIDLTRYFECDLKLSDVFTKIPSIGAHPYADSLVEDLCNGLQSADILSAITTALASRQRHLTFIPPTIQEAGKGKDKLKLWPDYIQTSISSIRKISMDEMLNCSMGVNPLDHLKVPTLLYVRAAKFDIWNAKQPEGKLVTQNSDIMGRYMLPKATAPYRLKVLDVPSWILNTITELAKRELNQTEKDKAAKNKLAHSETLQAMTERLQQAAEGIAPLSLKEMQQVLTRVAKTKFFNTYLMTKRATLSLAVTKATVALDQQLGKSVVFQIPLQASQLGKKGQLFYGRLQNISYTFTAAKTPRAKSTMSISCHLAGVTSFESPAKSIFEDDDPFFIYKRG